MIVQFVQFESALTLEECTAIAREREPRYAATPGLLQKYYLKLGKPNHFGGFLIWDSRESMLAFRETELAKTIPTAYKVIGAPDIDVFEMMFPLHDTVSYECAHEVA